MIEIDHLFICSKNDGDEANLIAESGFTEGEGRDHSGQGTTNRRFVFSNFFLEILWIKNQDEIQSDRIEKIGLPGGFNMIKINAHLLVFV